MALRILATFPGRSGDLLWALPTVRALSQHFRTPVDLCCCGEFAPLLPLLQVQPYLGTCTARSDWPLVPPAEWNPPADVALGYDRVYHLGYRGWPASPLPVQTHQTLREGWQEADGPVPSLDLETPWITVEGAGTGRVAAVAVGFTEYWFELKLGVLLTVEHALQRPACLQLTMPAGSRWTAEVPPGTVGVARCDWLEAARLLRNSDLFFGDCSALHVLAVALGKRAVIMEPMTERHNPIFWPFGQDGPRVRLVKGLDGQPTCDARHCADAIKEALCA